ncbi:MAG: hypothetical protein E6J59_06165 [Deltaproteobacteria bacterium]|nr:MAG: hypothetical protein E6J59_06165 [Deltaproteobacteria bacterium]
MARGENVGRGRRIPSEPRGAVGGAAEAPEEVALGLLAFQARGDARGVRPRRRREREPQGKSGEPTVRHRRRIIASATSREKTITAILDALGLPGRALVDAAGAPEAKARLRAETERAIALGVFGAPTAVVGDELFWGNDRLEDAVAWAVTAASRAGDRR